MDWSHARQEVRRLQMRIAKATQAGQRRKAQALHWSLDIFGERIRERRIVFFSRGGGSDHGLVGRRGASCGKGLWIFS
jgi:hypothetical protein